MIRLTRAALEQAYTLPLMAPQPIPVQKTTAESPVLPISNNHSHPGWFVSITISNWITKKRNQ